MPRSRLPRISPGDPVSRLVEGELLDTLSPRDLLVYLKLIRQIAAEQTRSIAPINTKLCRDERTALSALRSLERHGLIRIVYTPDKKPTRTVTVLG